MNGIILNPLTTTPGRETHDALSYRAEITGKDNFASHLFPESLPNVSVSVKSKLNRKRGSFELHDHPNTTSMKKQIQDNLVQKLNMGLMHKSKEVYKKIPWKYLKREDFVNWPNDVRLGGITHQGKQSLVKLYSNVDSIDFTKDFLDRCAKRRGRKKLP